ncbi:MAG: hypothetical protein QM715_21295 [Nibricoccus sp.]
MKRIDFTRARGINVRKKSYDYRPLFFRELSVGGNAIRETHLILPNDLWSATPSWRLEI